MPRYILRCDDCGQKYAFTPATPEEEFPNCPACTAGKRRYSKSFRLAAPGIKKSPLTKSMDKTYRDMEAASIERAQRAASLAGVPESAMSHLKITNMKDPTSVREGESSAIMSPPSREYRQLQEQLAGGGGFNPITMPGGGVATGEMFAAAASQGIGARSGVNTLVNMIKPGHQGEVARVEAAGIRESMMRTRGR